MVPLLLFVGGFTAVAIVIASLSGDQRTRRQLRRSTAKRIQELGDDERSKIVGRVRATGELVDAPVSGRPCVAFAVSVIVHGYNTSKTFRETSAVAFSLEDDSGRALVDPSDARIAVDGPATVQAGTLDDPIPSAVALLERHGHHFGRGTVFYREAIVRDGDTVAVL